MRWRTVVAAAALVAAACSDGESDAERDVRAEALARTKVTPERCIQVVAAQGDGPIESDSPFYDDVYSCRGASYDPVWEASGLSTTDEDYAFYAELGQETPMTATRRSIAEAGALSTAGVCPGDTSILTPSDRPAGRRWWDGQRWTRDTQP
jgi:hypothetical protein